MAAAAHIIPTPTRPLLRGVDAPGRVLTTAELLAFLDRDRALPKSRLCLVSSRQGGLVFKGGAL